MRYQLTIEFAEYDEKNIEKLNEILSGIKLESLVIGEAEGQIGNENQLDWQFSNFYSNNFYLLKKITLLCKEDPKGHIYQIDAFVFGEDGGRDAIAYELAWRNEYQDRKPHSGKCKLQDEYTIYFTVSREAEEIRFKKQHRKDMPSRCKTFYYDRNFTDEQLQMLARKKDSESSLDTWLWSIEADTLYIHRASTGECIYTVDITENNGRHLVKANDDAILFYNEDFCKAVLDVLLDKWCGITTGYGRLKFHDKEEEKHVNQDENLLPT